MLAATAYAGPAWVNRYDGPDNGGDEANMVVTDRAGNVYVTGGSETPANGDDWATIKLLPSGDTAWVRRADGWGHGEDVAYALAVDTAGNVIVTGYTTNTGANVNIATIKYDPDGNLVYVKEYDGPAHAADGALSVAVDQAGNAYVVGYVQSAANGKDWVIIKYLPSGDTAWSRQADGWGHGDDIIYGVALDPSGNIIASGYTTSTGGNLNTGTIKSDPDGNAIYVKEYDGPTHNEDAAYALAVDRDGNAYITGASVGATNVDYVTVKYLSNGDTAWTRCYNGPANGDDYAAGIAVDNAGNACVTGYSNGSGSGKDWLTIKYLPSGDTAWTRRANGWFNAADESYAVAVGPFGDVFVTGYTTSTGGNVNYGTIKYLSDGSLGWVEEYDGPVAGADRAKSIALDTAGNVFVTGRSPGSASALDYATVKYAATLGVAETPNAELRMPNVPTIVCGELLLPGSAIRHSTFALLNSVGRMVMDLASGPNDVGSLAPGVYFVRQDGVPEAARVLVVR